MSFKKGDRVRVKDTIGQGGGYCDCCMCQKKYKERAGKTGIIIDKSPFGKTAWAVRLKFGGKDRGYTIQERDLILLGDQLMFDFMY